MVERNAEGLHICLHICMVADNQSDIGIQISGLPLPKQLNQTMILFGDKDSQPFLLAYIEYLPVHLEPFRNPAEDRTHFINPLIQLGQVKLHSHKKHSAIRVHGILIRLDNIRTMLV
ncbi:hypothetical protein D3C74_386640 [compost metagenome]